MSASETNPKPQTEPAPSPNQNQLKALQDQISALKVTLQARYGDVARLKGEIFDYENANALFKHSRVAAVREHTETTDVNVEINDEHLDILTAKENELRPLRVEVSELRDSEELREAQVSALRVQCSTLDFQILAAKDDIQAAKSDAKLFQTELTHVLGQIRERTQEIRKMEETVRRANEILADHLAKSEGSEIGDGGRLDCEKAIETLRHDIKAAEAELKALTEENEARVAETERASSTLQETRTVHDRAVKWEKEKGELKAELDELTQTLRRKKGSVQRSESRALNDREQLVAVTPLIKKWKGARGDVFGREGATIPELLEELGEVKKAHEKAVRDQQEKIAALVMSNAGLEKEVQRSKAALDCAV
jgi:chromosome segregation ATPase